MEGRRRRKKQDLEFALDFGDLKTSKWSLYSDGANQKSIKHYLLEWLYSPVIDLFPLKMGFASKQNNSRAVDRQLGNTNYRYYNDS